MLKPQREYNRTEKLDIISHDIILFRWIEMNFISQLYVHDCQKIFSYILKSAIATIVTDNWLDKLCELFHLLLIHWKQWKMEASNSIICGCPNTSKYYFFKEFRMKKN